MARCARLSLVEATIFIVLVIFSILRIDLSRPSISRSVAYEGALFGEAPILSGEAQGGEDHARCQRKRDGTAESLCPEPSVPQSPR